MPSKQNTKYAEMLQKFNLQANAPMSSHTSFRVGGPADLLAIPETVEDLQSMLEYADAGDIPVTIIGGGTNVLISDKGIRGLVIITKALKMENGKWRMENENPKQDIKDKSRENENSYGMQIEELDNKHSLLSVMAGQKLQSVIRFAMNNSLSGLECAAGIPGTLGGAVVMNAGGISGNIGDLVQNIKVLDRKSLKIKTIKKEELHFSYRQLKLKALEDIKQYTDKNDKIDNNNLYPISSTAIIISACLKLKKDKQENIKKAFESLLSRKKQTQPISSASAGCFFKNPAEGMSAGELIDKAGLKGMRSGGAMVSPVHANFIVNTGNATCEDILRLKEHIEKTVLRKFQVQLETEVKIYQEA